MPHSNRLVSFSGSLLNLLLNKGLRWKKWADGRIGCILVCGYVGFVFSYPCVYPHCNYIVRSSALGERPTAYQIWYWHHGSMPVATMAIIDGQTQGRNTHITQIWIIKTLFDGYKFCCYRVYIGRHVFKFHECICCFSMFYILTSLEICIAKWICIFIV